MRIVPEKNAILLNLRNPGKILKLLPTSKQVSYKGKQVVAIPHRLDETRVLNNMGVAAPSPMLTKYGWPRSVGKIPTPFKAQELTAGFLSLNPRAFVLNGLGTGKSMASLWAYDYLRSKGVANKLLVVCPLSTMERTWADELFYHMPHLTHRVLYGSKAKRLKLLADDVDIYIVNHHGVHIIKESLASRPDIDHIIVDEVSQAARNQRTDMWKSLNVIANRQTPRSVWGMTATPIPNEPTDAYAQIKLIRPGSLKTSYTHFRNEVMQQMGPYRWVSRPNAVESVYQAMLPAIRFSRDQCVDLPPTIYMTREVPLTNEQTKAYKSMKNDLIAKLQAGEILAVNEAVKVSKLIQIACGVVYDSDHNEVTIPCKPRLDETVSLVEQSDSKTIVFVPFKSSVRTVADYITQKTNKTVGIIYGEVPKNKRDVIFSQFQRSGIDVIVAQPKAMSHGLTLTEASTIVWYAAPMSADTYEQANGRITRPGQKFVTTIVNIEGTDVERRLYHRLQNKMALQGLLLEKNLREVA